VLSAECRVIHLIFNQCWLDSVVKADDAKSQIAKTRLAKSCLFHELFERILIWKTVNENKSYNGLIMHF
jgi:hypothetical protein